MRKERLDNLTLTGCNEDKMDRRKEKVTYLMSMFKWMTAQVLGATVKKQTLRKGTKNMKLWRPITTHVLKGHGTELRCRITRKITRLNKSQYFDK